jgi:MoxR-like ATPase
MSEVSGDRAADAKEVDAAAKVATGIVEHLGRTVVGQKELRRRLVTALLTGGHILLEGVPGLAKTLSIKALAASVQGSFRRIQFTPDLLPADLIGTEIYRPQDGTFQIRRGPVFANFVLADEINRAPAKVQSALLETMQERQVTIGGETFELPRPFLVLATQNPIEQEGTYPLPEAQVDRFLMKVKVTYPSTEEERQILDHVSSAAGAVAGAAGTAEISPVASLDDVRRLQSACALVYLDERIKKYIVDLVTCSRNPGAFGLKQLVPLIHLGASPRSTISLYFSARAEALLQGQSYVVPQHVKNVAHDVFRHRIMLSYEAEAEGLSIDSVVEQMLDSVPVP